MNLIFTLKENRLKVLMLLCMSFLSFTSLMSQTFTELVIPKYFGSKTAGSSNNARTPVAFCFQIDGLTPSTAYDVKAGIGLTTDASTSFGAGNVWNGTTFGTSNLIGVFTTNASGSSGPVWVYVQPTGNASRFDAGMIHNLRIGYVVTGGSMPSAPAFISAKTMTALDIALAARTVATTDDGAFIAGSALSVSGGKYVLIFDNVAGTGDPLFAYQIRQANPTSTNQSELPTIINDIYMQAGASAAGDYPAIIPIGANNPNGVRRIESRNADNTLFASNTDTDGIWPSGANTTTPLRRDVVTITNTDAPLMPVVPTITVNSPIAGSLWKQGSSHPITWSASNANANVKIEFTDDASAGMPSWTMLAATVPATAGTWTWNIPIGQALSNDCKIRITDIPLSATGLSGTFSIIPPPPPIANIAALRAGTSGLEYTLTGQAVLTFQQTFRNQKFIEDATGAILIDDASGIITTLYTVGDGITGITGSLLQYSNGMLEFVPTENPATATSTGNIIIPPVVALADLAANFENYESELIRVNYCMFTLAGTNFANGTTYAITDLPGTAGNFRTAFYDVDYIGTSIPAGLQDITGIANSTSNTNSFITSRNLADIIASIPIPVITVTSPNGGEFWQQGTSHDITWTSSNFSGNIKIELTGTNPSVIIASTPNTGTYSWVIPAGQIIGADYKVMVSDAADGSPSDESFAAFSIIAPYTIPNIVITEIMYNSPGIDEEWVELYNNTSQAVDISGYYIIDDLPTHPHIVLPAGASIASGGYYTVEVATEGPGLFPFVPDYDGSGKFSLGNTTDIVNLYNQYNELVDQVPYADAAPWPSQPDGSGPTLTFCDPTQDNSIATYWSASQELYLTLQNDTIYATPGAGCYISADDITITEIMYNSPDINNDSIEFIELYNKGLVAADLTDWYFSKGIDYTFPATTIAPGSYMLLSRNAAAFNFTFGLPSTQWTSGFLDNNGAEIELKDAVGNVKDYVHYLPTTPWPAQANGEGPSLTLCDPSLDNSLPENWSASIEFAGVIATGDSIYATPLAGCGSGANLAFTEIMYNSPETGTDSLEFLEIYNNGNAINLEGFYFSSGIEYIFPSVDLAAGDYLLLAGNATAFQNTFGIPALQWTSGALSNSGETITLNDVFGNVVDLVTYDDAAPWDTLADGYGPSLTLCDPASDNTIPGNWKASSEFVTVNQAGDSIFATPGAGCFNPPPYANFVGTPTWILEGASVQFSDLSTNNPISWQWSFPGGTPDNSTEKDPSIAYLTFGLYSVTLTVTNAYGNDTEIKASYISVGGIGVPQNNENSFEVYPNPNNGKFTVSIPTGKVVDIRIMDMIGSTVFTGRISAGANDIDLSILPKGLYLIKALDKETSNQSIKKIIIK